jgi:hypothetical protein
MKIGAKLSHLRPDSAAPNLTENSEGQNQARLAPRKITEQPPAASHRIPQGPPTAASTPQQQTNRGKTVDTPDKSRLPQPLPRRRHRSHHHRCHKSLVATVILSGPPPRHPPLRRAQHNQPAPPSGAAAPTYHRSPRAATRAQSSCPQHMLLRATARRPRTSYHIRGRRPDVKSDRPLGGASTGPTLPPPKRDKNTTQPMSSKSPTS